MVKFRSKDRSESSTKEAEASAASTGRGPDFLKTYWTWQQSIAKASMENQQKRAKRLGGLSAARQKQYSDACEQLQNAYFDFVRASHLAQYGGGSSAEYQAAWSAFIEARTRLFAVHYDATATLDFMNAQRELNAELQATLAGLHKEYVSALQQIWSTADHADLDAGALHAAATAAIVAACTKPPGAPASANG